ncbi:MAG: DUF695 domain-containing protein [Terracidiphilus sp.]|jgi:uncharacterized protein (TIGR01619 family)
MTHDWKNWKPYLCNVNSKLASILVNLGLRDTAPISTKPWLLWAWVYFQSPRPNGLSSSEEAPTLYEIEDALISHVSEACQAILCGRITTEGRREFYFYGGKNEGFRNAVEAGLSGFKGYMFDQGEQKDPGWDQYLNVLYPSPADLQRIANMDLLEVLAEKGDIHTVAREVQHWLFFSSISSRASFRHAASTTGFKIMSETKSEGELPFVISVGRTQPIDQRSIDATVIELLNISRRFDGEYDGWETPVVTQ